MKHGPSGPLGPSLFVLARQLALMGKYIDDPKEKPLRHTGDEYFPGDDGVFADA